MNIITFAPFGYDGALVSVEADVRRGIPSVDIVGLADGAVKEARERAKAAIRNSGFDFPTERVLVSIFPADLKKEGAILDLPIAMGILTATGKENYIGEPVLVLGELELSGAVRPCRAVHAAVSAAFSAGIRYAVVPKANLAEAREIHGMKVAGVESLAEAENALKDISRFKDSEIPDGSDGGEVVFDGENQELDGMNLPKRLVRAIAIAVAGKHNLLAIGVPGWGKTLAIQSLVPALAPKLTWEESQSVTRIHSIAGLTRGGDMSNRIPPFRMPHQTASLEGICGGGLHCRPGEVSLAHNGFLFMDDAAEFRSTVLQMLRVPLESGMMTLSRAGRNTTYPARFQLLMAANPCPCGNCGRKDKVCLCSALSAERYWQKFSSPLIDRIGIICRMESDDEKEAVSVAELRSHIKNAFEIQRKHGTYNQHLSPQELLHYFKADDEAEKTLSAYAKANEVSARGEANIRKVALTVANMDGRETVSAADVREAISYSRQVFDDLQAFSVTNGGKSA